MSRLPWAAVRAAAVVFLCLLLSATPDPTAAQSSLSRSDLREIQETLNDLGYQAGPEDGLYGDKTAEAIRRFERANDLTVTGEADRTLLKELRRRIRTRDASESTSQGADSRNEESQTSGETSSQDGESAQPQATTDTQAAVSPSDGENPIGSTAGREGAPETANAGSADSSVEGRSSADVSVLLSTRWRVRDESGATFTMTFRANGNLNGPTISGDWTWHRRDDKLVIEFKAGPNMSTQRTAPWPGSDDKMSGTAQSSTGREWSWSAQKIGGSSSSS